MEQLFEKALAAARGKITDRVTPDDMPKATQAVLNLVQARAIFRALPKNANEMEDEVGTVLSRVRPNLTAVEMMKSTQAVLNIMHAKAQDIAPAKTKTS